MVERFRREAESPVGRLFKNACLRDSFVRQSYLPDARPKALLAPPDGATQAGMPEGIATRIPMLTGGLGDAAQAVRRRPGGSIFRVIRHVVFKQHGIFLRIGELYERSIDRQ